MRRTGARHTLIPNRHLAYLDAYLDVQVVAFAYHNAGGLVMQLKYGSTKSEETGVK